MEQTQETQKEREARRLEEEKGFKLALYGHPTDGDGQVFEYDKTYYYWNGTEVDTIKTKYHCNALGEQKYSNNGSIFYHHYKNHNDSEKSLNLKLMFNSMERALAHGLQITYRLVEKTVVDYDALISNSQATIAELNGLRDKILKDLEKLKK